MGNLKKAVIIVGPPGAGKGTQAEILAKKLGYFHFETSHIVKAWMEKNPDHDLVKESLEEYSHGGLFIPKLVVEVVSKETERILADWDGIVYDGSPRTLKEGEKLWPILLGAFGSENITIFYIELSLIDAQHRLAKRLICSNGHSFIDGENGMAVGIPCPEDGSLLGKRDLDDPKIMEVRFDEFEKESVPAIDFLKQHHQVIEIDGNRPVEQVAQAIGEHFA